MFFWSWAALWAAASSGCAVTHSGGPENIQPLSPAKAFDVQKNIIYTPKDWAVAQQADVYTPRGAGPFPAVLVVHGGGWARGSRYEMEHICKRLAEQGFVAVNIDYRLAPAHIFPAQLQDVQQAMLWMHAQAKNQKIDTQRLAVWGYSAGAQLAALLGALSPGDPNFVEGTRVQAVVAGGTPVDLRKGADSKLIRQYIGKPIAELPEPYRKASPIAFVSADDPPTFLYHGSIDWIVAEINATRMRDELERVGVPVELYIVHGVGHIGAYFNRGATDAGVDFLIRRLR
ncbi:alpha/beta hydrolase [Stenotrophobium rhamnosiphilum]|nr:alpha/beta hydrolase [Stenotrophobium rhamnosiphilum]